MLRSTSSGKRICDGTLDVGAGDAAGSVAGGPEAIAPLELCLVLTIVARYRASMSRWRSIEVRLKAKLCEEELVARVPRLFTANDMSWNMIG